MLKELLAITGKPGLFRIVSHGKNNLIVEELTTKKRFSVSARAKVVSLGDIAMYTMSDDKPLGEILDIVYKEKDGKPIDVKKLVNEGKLREEFAVILPDFDRERVYDNDIKKLFNWYNLLIGEGMTDFTEKKDEASVEEEKNVESDKESEK